MALPPCLAVGIGPGEELAELEAAVGVGEEISGTVGGEIERLGLEVGDLGSVRDVMLLAETAEILTVDDYELA